VDGGQDFQGVFMIIKRIGFREYQVIFSDSEFVQIERIATKADITIDEAIKIFMQTGVDYFDKH